MEQKKIGLIGRTLKHSYSKIIHDKFGEYDYRLYEIEPEQLNSFSKGDLNGFNVTIPYKKDIMPYLDQIDEFAKSVGAVNTVVKKCGKLYGYNTDFNGMLYMLDMAGINLNDKNVMILGSGGTSNTAIAVAKYCKAKSVVVVSRSGKVNYNNCYDLVDTQIIINTTPVGMYPNIDGAPVDISKFPRLVGVADAIYNPSLTMLTYKAKESGLKYTNGLPMLVAQAKYAMEHFIDNKCDDSIIQKIIDEINLQTLNVVLIGMPSCGKSSIGRAVAEKLNREFIDTDSVIEQRVGKSIPQIFNEHGEEYFRRLETQVIKDVCIESGKVIATGGGVVKKSENEFFIKCNSKVIYIDRNVELLVTDGRPLSKDKSAIKRLYNERKDLYNKIADIVVENNGDISCAINGVLNCL